jgi:hypothetical protein
LDGSVDEVRGLAEPGAPSEASGLPDVAGLRREGVEKEAPDSGQSGDRCFGVLGEVTLGKVAEALEVVEGSLEGIGLIEEIVGLEEIIGEWIGVERAGAPVAEEIAREAGPA